MLGRYGRAGHRGLDMLDRVWSEVRIYQPDMAKTLGRWVRGRPTIKMGRSGNGQLYVSDGRRLLAIVNERRAIKYKRGIEERIGKLMADYHVAEAHLSPGELVVNFGANIGELAIGLLAKGCRVVAIEPDPAALTCLNLNCPGEVEIVPTGVWNEDGDLTFYQKPASADTSAILSHGLRDAPTLTIPAIRLDTLLADRGRIRLLVGDAEGGEPEVLEGAAGILPQIDYVSIACGPERNGERTIKQCCAILRGNGFQILHESDYLFARNDQVKDVTRTPREQRAR